MRWRAARLQAAAAALLALVLPPVAAPASPPAPPPTHSCRSNTLCLCHGDHFACSNVPFYRFPETDASVRHVAVSAAQLGALGEAALDARALRTLVVVASRLHHIDARALASMTATLASLDLGYNEFTEIPIEALRELKVLNWLSLQNNYISDLDPEMDWGFLEDSLSSLSLSNNQLCVLREGALSALRTLAQLDLDGNRLRIIEPSALPPALALLRVTDNILQSLSCDLLELLPRLQHLHLRNNMLASTNSTCRGNHYKIDFLDLSHNELDDSSELQFKNKLQLKQLILDLNEFTAVPALAADSHLERLSMSYNRLSSISEATLRALERDLERLDLDHNELVSLPASMQELTRLRHLSLAYNHLKDMPELPPRLRYLSLAGNFLTKFPKALQRLAPGTLSYLDLGYNLISELRANVFGPWADGLVTLSLRGNSLAQLTTGAFPAGLPLRELVLSYNELFYVEPTALANLTALQALELSSTLHSGEFPVAAPADTLWLSLDNNDIHIFSTADIENFPSLEYLNLDFNKLVEFPSEANESSRTYRLKELRLAYNYVSRINAQFMCDLTELQSLDLSYNRVRNVTERTFVNLKNLVYINLAVNVLDDVADGAFLNLPKLEVLDLQENNLMELSLRSFGNVSNENTIFSVNVSHNKISRLVGGPITSINILDLSHNLVKSVTRKFFTSIGPHIRQLVLCHNKLTHMESGITGHLPNLEILNLHSNNISSVRRRFFVEMPGLQILDLSNNRLAQLAPEQFTPLGRLRDLRLDGNQLRTVPRDALRNTVLEHLDLSENNLLMYPSSALAAVGFTLRRLELAHNQLEYIDAAMLQTTPFLHELNLAHNSLTVLADSTLVGLPRLHRLDLSHNSLKANFRELLHNVPLLRRLALGGAGLRAAPPLPLAHLTELDLAGNNITALREADLRRIAGLRSLHIAHNRLTSLQPATWSALPHLVSLDVSQNPIVRVGRGVFEGLDRLLHLRMDRLQRLEALEPRAFRPLVSLRSLDLESLAGNASLADVVSSTPALEALRLYLHGNVLDDQLIGINAPKLRALEINGVEVHTVTSRAFSSFGRQSVLALRLTHTSVSSLPPGLVQPLTRVPHLALDFSDNRLHRLGPTVLYANHTDWRRLGTKLLPGGLLMSGNSMRCGCTLVWLGAWLRRWAGEVGGGSRAAMAAVRRSTCVAARGLQLSQYVPLVTQQAECRASALSSRATAHHSSRPGWTCLAILLWTVLFHSLS